MSRPVITITVSPPTTVDDSPWPLALVRVQLQIGEQQFVRSLQIQAATNEELLSLERERETLAEVESVVLAMLRQHYEAFVLEDWNS